MFFRLEEQENALLTPFEKNLEVWRQLWRVVERSGTLSLCDFPSSLMALLIFCADIVIQIVDARNPLLFYCRDLEEYAAVLSPVLCDIAYSLTRFSQSTTPGTSKRWTKRSSTCCS
jgi:hypothetical protein